MNIKQNTPSLMGMNKTIVDWFEDQAKQTPEAIAVIFEEQQLSFKTLDLKANQLANHLLKYELGEETLVAICVERSVEMIIGILGILKAGAAYLPLSPELPKDRLQFMLEDTSAPIILTQEHLSEKLVNPCQAKIICLDKDWAHISKENEEAPHIDIKAENLIYTIYTSGSTGKPKGVLIEHRNVVNLVQSHLDVFQLPVERFLYAYSFAFDGSVLLIFQTLLQGATLVIAPENLEKDIKRLSAFIEYHKISNLLSFPSLYAILLDQAKISQLQSLKSVNLAGEALPASLVIQHQKLLSKCRIVNQYGPTEATVGTTVYIVPPNFNQKKVPIGTCVDHTQIFILNEDGEALGPGETGEIHIAGAGVARGYLNRPSLTASKFIPNPFSENKEDKLYKTGDLAQWLPDGNIDFIGRIDFQVKLRGYRIELGEIEAVLSQHHQVREVVTIITDAEAADQKLVAYIVPKKSAQLNTSQLRAYLQERLPDYMIPAFFQFLDKMPLANSGKIDRKALPQPGKQRPELKQNYIAPETKLEKFIAKIWCQILALDKIGTQDKFFELGGNSLQAAKFINIIQETLGEAVFIVSIFDTPTIASYAAMLEKDYPESVKRNFHTNFTEETPVIKTKLNPKDFDQFDQLVPHFIPNPKKEQTKNPPAIFILAPPRSGTTLLRVMLAGHPGIFAANELQLLGFNTLKERNQAYQEKFSLWQEGLIRTIMDIKSIDAHEAKTIIQEFENKDYTCQEIYLELQNWIGDKILVDKSPSYATDPAILQNAEQNFDQAIYIHLVRHPYAMISSFARMHMDQVMYLKKHDYTAKELGELIWTKSHQNILGFLDNIPKNRQFRINYEDLVQDPKQVMEALCQTIGIDFHPDLLSPYKDLDKKMTDGIYADSKPMGDIRLLSHKKINPELSKSWEGVLKDNFISDFTWTTATQLAYPHPDQVLRENTAENEQQKQNTTEHQSSDIAIIGMSGRFAGAKNIDAFWNNLVKAVDVSVSFTPEELKAEGINPEVLQDPNYVNRGMPLEDADCFDASFFGYLPKEAALMDPQHRIFLECAYEALEDTGYDPEKYNGTIGIFGGVARNTYLINNVLTHPQYFKSLDDFVLGITLEKDFPSTRVAYKLNLKGPAVNIQTACSSSGVAVHLACQSILSGDSDMVLVGGGRIQPPVHAGHFHKEGHALSPDGYCKAFDAEAQGMVRGNGMAFIAIKKLSQAIADGDTIHAVIKGTAINNDGSDKIGFTAPSIKGQTAAISKAYKKAGINPETISYIEAHGTGTLIGDPIEIAGLTKAFQQFTDKKGFCAIGSVKTNIGHLDAGASIAGIIKTVLALKHQVIPPTLHFKKANPQIEFEKTPFFVNDQLRKWETNDLPRRAGVSSFGLGGTNAHIILEEAPKLVQQNPSRSHHLILLSAKTESAIHQASLQLGEYLEQHPDTNLHHIASTLQEGRKHFRFKKILIAQSTQETADYLLKNDKRHIISKTTDKAINKVVFMFPGGGAQHSNMGWNLYQEEPVFREAVDTCLNILKDQHQLELKDILYPPRTTEQAIENKAITDPLHAITLLFTIEYATAKLWMSWGIVPSEMIGHSLGEYTAACIAGVISLKDSLALVAKRGQLFKTLEKGAMLSIPLAPTEVEKMMDEDLSFAAINKPDHCVVSGSVQAIDRIKEKLNKKEIHAPRLHISVAAHSKMLTPILEEFESFLKTINYHEAQIPIVSNVTGQWVKPGEIQQPSYWVKHLRQTVKFSDGISQIFKLSERFLLEIGPGQTLSTFARQHPQKPTGQLILASLKHPKEKTDDLAFILKTLGHLWLSGKEIDWSLFAAHLPFQRTSLPPYPFEKKRFWIEAKPSVPITPQPKTTGFESIAFNEKQTTMSVPEVQRKNLVTRDLKDIFHQLSGISPDELTDYATFLELGFDSLFLTQAISKIKKKFKVKLNFRQLFDDLPTIDTLSEYIDEQLPAAAYQEEINQAKLSAEKPTQIQAVNNQAQPQIERPIANFEKMQAAKPIAFNGTIQDVINQQLSLMQQQLALLSGGQLQSNSPIKLDPSTPIAAPKKASPQAITQKPANKEHNKIQDQGEKHGPWRPIDKKDSDGLNEQQRKYLDQFIQYYTNKTKSSQALITKQRPNYADPRSITTFNKLWKDMVYQIAVNRSKGSKLWDLDGNEYVDYVMAFGISLMGHTPDFIQEAVKEQLEKGLELGVLTPLAHQVAELLHEMTGMERITFVNTGSEALAAAVRAARTVSSKDKIIVFEGDYHGISDELLARSITRNGKSVTMPVSPGIPLSLMQNVIVLDYDAPNILEVIQENADELAAILIEPIQPMNPHIQRKELFHQIRKITADNDIALIFDEMITGFRVAPRGAQEWFDIEVDLVCYGKIISGGLPMAALAGKSKYLDVFDGGMWQFGDQSIPEAGVTFFGGTFVKHPLSLAAAHAALSEIKRRGPQLYIDLNKKTQDFAERLKALFLRTKVPLQVFSTASIFSIKVVDNNPLSRLFYFYLRAKGVHLTERAGLVSTAHTAEDLDFTYNVIEEIIKEMQTAGFFKITLAEIEDQNKIVPSPLIGVASESSNKKQKKKIPLTEGQQEIWLEQQLGNDAAAAYNLSSEISLRGQICLKKMKEAVQALIDRHEALRTRFHKNELFQTILPSVEAEITLLDLTDLEENEKITQLESLRFEEGEKAFDIFEEALFRVKIIRLAEGDHRLLMTAHHIIADGWSCGILANDLSKLYTAACTGQKPELPEAKQLSTFALEKNAYQGSEAEKEAAEFWLNQFKDGTPVLEFPTDRSRPALKTYAAACEKMQIETSLYEALQLAAKKYNTTFFNFIYTAFQSFIYRLSQQDDFVLGITAASQATSDNPYLVAHGVNLIPVRLQTNGQASFAEQLKSTRNIVLDAFEHQNYAFGALVKALQLPRDLSRQPIVSIIFNMDTPMGELNFSEMEVAINPLPRNYETFDCFINVKPQEKGILFEWIYNTDLFEATTIQRRLAEFKTFIESIILHPETSIDQLNILPEQEKEQLALWNNTQAAYPKEACIHTLFEKQVEQRPNKIAVEFKDQYLSYEELNIRANQLSNYLLKKGIKKTDFVGLYLDRSIDMLVGLLAIMKVGGIYVPLDPVNPTDRLQVIMEDAQAKYMITQKYLMQNFADPSIQKICLEEEIEQINSQSILNINEVIDSTDSVYVNYTSGSTGKPKGVIIPHYAVIDHHLAMQEAIGITAEDRIFGVASISFDPSVQDLFLPLIIGAKIIIGSHEAKTDGFLLKDRLEASKATLMQATPATWRMLLLAGWQGNKNFTALCGGEGLTKELSSNLIHRTKALYNIYGPTETTIWSTTKKLTGDRLATKAETGYEPIGRPMKNVQIYILDQYQQEVPIGTAGEIYVGGVGVAPNAYFKRPALSVEKFIPNPFSDTPGLQLYRTGDIARYLSNGDIEYLRRADNQVKIRGFRIELGEIESTIAQFEGIRENVVIVREDQKDNKELVAYLIIEQGFVLDHQNLKAYLKEKLPSYMVPIHYVVMDAFPLTATMKINRSKLPVPERQVNDLGNSFVPASSKMEKLLANIWSELLGIPKISILDSFFDLGGHSLIAVNMMAKIEKATGKKLPLSSLIGNPNIQRLAKLLNQSIDQRIKKSSLIPIKPDGNKPPIYILHGAGNHVLLFNTLASHMDKNQPVYGLEPRGLDGEADPLDRMEDIAAHYIAEILKVNSEGPYALAGYSFGGLIAFEMAQQLEAMGKKVMLLGMFDTVLRPEITGEQKPRGYYHKLSELGKKIVWNLSSILKDPIPNIQYKSYTWKRRYQRWLFSKAKSEGTALNKKEIDYAALVDRMHQLAYDHYRIKAYHGKLHLFRAKERRFYMDDFEYLGWKAYAKGGIIVQDVPGDHLNLFNPPNGQRFARILQACLDEAAIEFSLVAKKQV